VIVPGRRTIIVAALFALLLIGAVVDHIVVVVVMLGDLSLLALCYRQGRQLRRLPVDVRRQHWSRVQVDEEESFDYQISNRSRHAVIVRLRQQWPTAVDGQQNELEVRVGPSEIVRVALAATPRMRGSVAVEPAEVDIRFTSDWARWRWATEAGELKVFPSLRGMSEYEALRRHHASSYGGLHRQRMLGSGREFEQLRDYFPDDDFRDINWKATARRNRPITNIYQAERSQDLLLCLDCGRMMGNPVGAGTALDHAIDASIMLAHMANRQSDRVGLVLFRDVVHRFIKPAAGMAAVHRIIEELVDAQTQGVFPSYSALMTALRAHQNRRSLIFLFTDLNDPQLATNLAEVLPVASRRHVLVVVSLRDPLLDQVAKGSAEDRRGVYQVLAARQLATERATRTRELQRIGAIVLEADAGSLTMKLLNTYLSIKTRQLL
jgi:uncharacterized protein (DUF58 family)